MTTQAAGVAVHDPSDILVHVPHQRNPRRTLPPQTRWQRFQTHHRLIAVIVALVITIVVIVCVWQIRRDSPLNQVQEAFDLFLTVARRSYPTSRELAKRFLIFGYNFVLQVPNYNAWFSAADTFGISDLWDHTQSEFEYLLGMQSNELPGLTPEAQLTINASLSQADAVWRPDAPLDWCGDRNPLGRSVCTSVKSQQSCGCCVNLASVSVAESAYAIQNNLREPVEFDTTLATSCSNALDPSIGTTDGCSGAHTRAGFRYITQTGLASPGILGSLLTQEAYYRSHSAACPSNPAQYSRYDFSSWCIVRLPSDDVSISRALVAFGPLLVSLRATGWQLLMGGAVLDDPAQCAGVSNHAVTLVGWRRDPLTGTNRWRIRNSWGPSWNDHGFVDLLRNDTLAVCNLGQEVYAYAPRSRAASLCMP